MNKDRILKAIKECLHLMNTQQKARRILSKSQLKHGEDFQYQRQCQQSEVSWSYNLCYLGYSSNSKQMPHKTLLINTILF